VLDALTTSNSTSCPTALEGQNMPNPSRLRSCASPEYPGGLTAGMAIGFVIGSYRNLHQR
jgi:hypothetical protein